MAQSQSMITRVLLPLIRIAIGGPFVVAGVIKAVEPSAFVSDIAGYQILPYHAVVVLSLYLPWLEIVCGTALIFRKYYLGSLAIAGSLLFVFTVAIASAWWRGLDISCGCFGHSLVREPYGWLITRDLLLLALTGGLFWLEIQPDGK
jgi:putative oxidoreductase